MGEKKRKTPSIRFQYYSDDWELCKLSEMKDVRDGTHDSPKYKENGYPLVTSKNLKSLILLRLKNFCVPPAFSFRK